MPTRIYRKDYKPPNYLIKTTQLIFELLADKVIVHNTMAFYKNPGSEDDNTLFLNGEDLKLLAITQDGSSPNYEIVEGGIKVFARQTTFNLSIITEIYPAKNTSLSGLYQSGQNFCTQCEAEGFRRISYYLDRPDVLSVFTTKIIANRAQYPYLLSNGDVTYEDKNSTTWHDPYPKPCYLFALVAGNFSVLTDEFKTREGRAVSLKIYTEAHNAHKTKFAMLALKKAFAWDERRFGLSYDLNTYTIVAVDDFNSGAMENKSLNIFNTKYVLADVKTATDSDFFNIESVIGHEYFHNWTGNRITCRDWFQLSLKEGLTVFRDQEFSADEFDRSIKRIDDVFVLRARQFSEDSGTMSHSVRPQSYIKINNFYTATVYEKGAELVRMLHTFLGEAGFQAGMKLYIKRHDGKAATIDDFVSSMAHANGEDFSQFMQWYAQPGTPTVDISTHYEADKKTCTIKLKQTINGKPSKLSMPFAYALFDKKSGKLQKQAIEIFAKQQQKLRITNIAKPVILSPFRNFSAPVIINDNNSINDKIQLLKYESDGFSTWDNAQYLWLALLQNNLSKAVQLTIFATFTFVLQNQKNDALLARLLTLPSEAYLHQQIKPINPQAIYQNRQKLQSIFAGENAKLLLERYQQLNEKAGTKFNAKNWATRSLKNVILLYLLRLKKYTLIYKQFRSAKNMTDQYAAFYALVHENNPYRLAVIDSFYKQHEADIQVIDKWFVAQVSSRDTDENVIKKLSRHKKFSLNNPNRLRAVYGSWCANGQFHHKASYQLLAQVIIKLSTINPQMGASLCKVFNHHKDYISPLANEQKQVLKQILKTKNLSHDILEVVQNALKP